MNPCTQEPSRKEVWKMFDRISPTYDRINRILSFGIDQRWRKQLCAYLPEKQEIDVLDCATGTGDQILALMRMRPAIRSIIGVDLAEAMMAIGKKKMARMPYAKKVSFVRASAEQLPFADQSFDCVSISFGIRNVENVALGLSEFYRVLKPHGRVLILEGTVPSHPLLRIPHLFYLRAILPRIGGLLSKNPNAYRYLNETIETFPQGEKFCALLSAAGFSPVRAHPLLGGVATIYQGERDGV